MLSSAEMTSCMKLCGSCNVVGCREWISYAAAQVVGDVGLEGPGLEEDISLCFGERKTRGQGRKQRWAEQLGAHVME